MKQHQITGIGPKQSDGSVELFTILPAPYKATAAWLAAQTSAPAMGDKLVVSDAGDWHLLAETPAAAIAANENAAAQTAQKKSAGPTDSASGSEPSHFSSYRGKPITVHASEITAVGEAGADGSRSITLTGGGVKIAAAGMMSRMVPVEGDYWVMVPQDDGFYEYLNPKAVFEAKYDLIEA